MMTESGPTGGLGDNHASDDYGGDGGGGGGGGDKDDDDDPCHSSLILCATDSQHQSGE
jgi:hypothetical protein